MICLSMQLIWLKGTDVEESTKFVCCLNFLDEKTDLSSFTPSTTNHGGTETDCYVL